MKKRKNQVLKKAKKIFQNLKFEEASHTYSVNNQKIPSTSSIVHKFYEPFDSEKVSFSISKGNLDKQKALLEDWENKKLLGIERGNSTHLFAEDYEGGDFIPDWLTTYPLQKQAVVDFWKSLSSNLRLAFKELRMYHLKYMYGGTSDFGLVNENNELWIGDYKTNKDLFRCYRGQKLLKPFNILEDNSFNRYQIQLSLYQLLLEQLGYKVVNRILVWLKPEGGFEVFETKDFTETLKIYLEHDQWGIDTESSELLF